MKCPRCKGSGRVSFRRDCGMCYRCQGSGEVAEPAVKAEPAAAVKKPRGLRPPTEEELHSMLF